MTDASGGINSIHYNTTNNFSTNLISHVVDAFGRTNFLQYDGAGYLTNIIDVVGISSAFLYDTNGWATNLTTPYGTTLFDIVNPPVENTPPNGRSILVTEPNGAKHLYLYTNSAPGIAASYTLPDTTPFTNTFETNQLDFRNSFYWGPRQYDALSTTNIASFTTNDFRKASMQHWLKSDDGVGETLSISRTPSADADGSTEGHKTWFDYSGKTNNAYEGTIRVPLLVADILPDGTTRFSRSERNSLGFATNEIATYSIGSSVLLRTNIFGYATNEIDLLVVTNALGLQVSSNVYNSAHQVLTNVNALGEETIFTYDPDGRLTSITTASGLTRTNIYYSAGDYTGWLQEIHDIEIDRTKSFTYDKGLVKTLTDERGLTLTFDWDELQRMTKITFPDSSFISNRYEKMDLVQTVDRMNFTNSFQYDELQRLRFWTNAHEKVSEFQYCDCGSLSHVVNPLSQTTSFTYDLRGHLTGAQFPDLTTISNVFDLPGQLVRRQDAAGNWTTNFYNVQGLLTAASNTFGQLFTATYDIEDHVTEIVDRNGVTTTRTFDELGRVLTQQYGGQTPEQFAYNPRGVWAHTNQLGDRTLFEFDPVGRLLAMTNANLEVNRLVYNAAGDLLTLTDGEDHTVKWGYDIYGDLRSKTNAANVEVLRLDYDLNGRLTNRWTVAKGDTGYTYDKVSNLKTIDYPNSHGIQFDYDVLDRLTNMVDAVGTTRFTYTSGGFLETEDGPWNSDTITHGYQHRRRASSSLAQPAGSPWALAYEYDAANRLTNITSDAGSFVYAYVSGAIATPSALVQKLAFPSGSYITNSYDALARLTQTALQTSGGNILNAHRYGYNDWSQRIAQTNLVMGITNSLEYGYDKIGQLKQATGKEFDGTPRMLQKLGYAYDQAGNLNIRTNNNLIQTFNVNVDNQLTAVNRNGALTVAGLTTPKATNVTVNTDPATLYADKTFAREVTSLNDGTNTFTAIAEDAAGRKDTNSITVNLPESVAFTYDDNGNLTSDSNRTFQYDDENQLTNVFVSGSWKSEFVYDGFQRRRVRKEYAWQSSAWVLTNEVRYLYDGRLVIQERDGNNTPLVTYTRGADLSGTLQAAGGIGGLLARTDHSTGKSAFYHADGNGNVTGLANSSELLVAKYLYDPFGFTLAKDGPLADANAFRFSSKEIHAPSGLYHYGFRYYDPGLQRWINQDPIGELGGINLFGFVGNNPANMVDPDGRFGIAGALIGGAIGGIVSGVHAYANGASGSQIGAAAAKGAAVGAVVGATGGLIGQAALGAGVSGPAALALGGLYGSVAGQTAEMALGMRDSLSPSEAAMGAALGGLLPPVLNKARDLLKRNPCPPRVAPALSAPQVPPIIDDLSRAGRAIDRNGLTKAGNHVKAHGDRPGSAFPKLRGTPSQINDAGQNVIDDILTHPGSTTVTRYHARFKNVIEIRDPTGRGVRFGASGDFINLLEP